MKILLISHLYPYQGNQTKGLFVHKQVLALKKAGCEVIVINPIPWVPFPLSLFRKWRALKHTSRYQVFDGVTVYHPRYLLLPKAILSQWSGFFMYVSIRMLAVKIYKNFKFDLISAHVALPAGYAALMLRKKFKTPVVVTMHGQDLQETLHRNKSCFKTIARVIQNSDGVIVVSSKLKNLAHQYYSLSNPIHVINNGIDTTQYDDLTMNLVLTHMQKPPKQAILLSVSNLYQSKGVDLNLKAVSALINKYPNLHYQIIGKGPDENKLKKLTSSLGIDKAVSFLGSLDHQSVIEHMKKADIFVLPSWNEGFGIVYLEAMACGKPVIACQGQGIADVIENKVNGFLVEPYNLDSLTTTLDLLISSPEIRSQVGFRAKKLVLNSYTWATNAQQTIQVYKEALADAE